jgi:hypothetical protein
MCDSGVADACSALQAAYRGTCSPWVYKEKTAQKGFFCDALRRCSGGGDPSTRPTEQECDAWKENIKNIKGCLNIRRDVFLNCYGGSSSSDDGGHERQIKGLEEALARCEGKYLQCILHDVVK